MRPLPLDAAAAALHAAAVLADALAAGDPFNPWTALAAQLRLVAAGLHPAPTTQPPRCDTPAAYVTAALDQLTTADPGAAGDTDLAFWRRHVQQLHEHAVRLEAHTGQPQDTP